MSDDLAKRIDRLESIEAIKKLKHLYMNYCDLGYPPEKLERFPSELNRGFPWPAERWSLGM